MSGAAKKACQEDDKWAGWSARNYRNVSGPVASKKRRAHPMVIRSISFPLSVYLSETSSFLENGKE